MFTYNFLPWSAETTNVQIGCDNSHINCFKTIKSCFLLSLIIQFSPNDISLFSPPEYVSQSHPHVYPIQYRPPTEPSRPHPPLLLTPEAFMKCENPKFLLRGCYNLNTVNITRPCCILRVSSCRLFYACQAIQSTNSANQTRHSWAEKTRERTRVTCTHELLSSELLPLTTVYDVLHRFGAKSERKRMSRCWVQGYPSVVIWTWERTLPAAAPQGWMFGKAPHIVSLCLALTASTTNRKCNRPRESENRRDNGASGLEGELPGFIAWFLPVPGLVISWEGVAINGY